MKEFISAMDQICEEKGISKEKVIETIEMAIAAAYKKDHGLKGLSVRAVFDQKNGGFDIFQSKLVVDQDNVRIVEEDEEEELEEEKDQEIEEEDDGEPKKLRYNEEKHIFLEEAQKLNFSEKKEAVRKTEDGEEKHQIFVVAEKKKDAKVKNPKIEFGDEIWLAMESQEDYGRIAAQTAKQVVIQRIREAERESIFDEFKEKEGEVITAIVQRIEKGIVFVDIGKASGAMFPEDQISGEFYRIGQRMKVYVSQVQKDSRGPGIVVSRTRPEMISKLFEIEVPEIVAGTVQIKNVAREAGSRSKIAVFSDDEDIDPIGACVGQRGTRVQAVINELGGEKVDIIEWSDDPEKFIANALSPAKVIDVEANEKDQSASVQVPEDQLSLAIGKQGQNVRLAARLTGWKIDILTESGEKIESEEAKSDEDKEDSTDSTVATPDKKKKSKDGKKEEKKEKKKTKKSYKDISGQDKSNKKEKE